MISAEKLGQDGERMVPDFHKSSLIYAEHIIRYNAALDLAKDKVVLDIASGSGYGTKILSNKAKKVYGVDVDQEAISYAQKNYGGKNIEYLLGNGEEIPLSDDSVDLVVTLETIEHIENYKKFTREIKRVLKKDGLAIISTPNDLEFAEGNHFHLHEFEYEELLGLIKKDFKYVKTYFQATMKFVAIGREETLKHKREIDYRTYNYADLNKEQFLYFYFLCSNRKISEDIIELGAIGEHYSDRKIIDMQTQQAELHKTIIKINTQNSELGTSLEETRNSLIQAKHELTNIKNSRAYKYAKKISAAKRKLVR